jgi:hypothetical protein
LGRVGSTPLHQCMVIAAPPGRDISPPSTTCNPGYAPVQQMPPT